MTSFLIMKQTTQSNTWSNRTDILILGHIVLKGFCKKKKIK